MAEGELLFDYVAVDASGRRVKGAVSAHSDAGAFQRLKYEGLQPLRIHASKSGGIQHSTKAGLKDRDLAAFLSELSGLLGAGADMRTALGILGGAPRQGALARGLATTIGGGSSPSEAFASHLGKNGAFVAALIASGDLPGGMQRAADVIQSRVSLRDQFIGALSYPLFVLVSTLAALAVIVLFVAPALAPLVADSGGRPPFVLGLLIGVSAFLQKNGGWLAILLAAVATGGATMARLGLLARAVQNLVLDGPFRRTAGGLIFGGFAISLGNMLTGGASMTEALRLAIRSIPTQLARERLSAAVQAVREGQALSSALGKVPAFPGAIVRLAAVGEASGALGSMLTRAGKLEEDAAIKRIETAGRLLGPILIVGLGAVIGLLMGGVLTGVSQLGQTALQ